MPEDLIEIKKNKSESTALCCPDNEEYPYGTSLDFSDEMVDMLGVGSLAINDIVEIRGFAYVQSKSEHDSESHSSKSVSLQLTAVNISTNDNSRVNKLYGDNDDK